ncbi:MAG: lytic murein transglycosylase B [Gammaproteobacteria bacterium]|nr:lytic murein transglycosylase B [Gammaproteobacteria bacterium]MDH3505862.1 lytic murein transglycosylase B [Gammaproteobacteria bacterium]
MTAMIPVRFVRIFAIAAACLLAAASGAYAQDAAQAQADFIARMVASHGFERDSLEALFAEIEINDRVLEAISRPAERVLAWYEYQDLFLTEARIASGVEFWTENAGRIEAVSEAYGVPAQMIVAILGIETWFGTRMGSYRVLESLSTLAFAYPRRSRFFSNELEAFLLLARDEQFDPLGVLGSYAGAMGAGQFIPTSFRAYAVDGDSDGRRDLWENWEDVLGSVANYFKVHGWRADEPVVARAARAPGDASPVPANSMDLNETVASLKERGYEFTTAFPESTPVTVLGLEGRDGTEYWVGYHNFRVITRYNRSVMYALVAQQLGEAIAAALERSAATQSLAQTEDAA